MLSSVGAGLLVVAGGAGGNGGGIVGGGAGEGGGIPRGGGGDDNCVAAVSRIRLIHSTLGFRTGAGTEESLGWLPDDPAVIGRAGEDAHAEVSINSPNSLGIDLSRVADDLGGVGLRTVSGEATDSAA
jgi:hypothetical protein